MGTDGKLGSLIMLSDWKVRVREVCASLVRQHQPAIYLWGQTVSNTASLVWPTRQMYGMVSLAWSAISFFLFPVEDQVKTRGVRGQTVNFYKGRKENEELKWGQVRLVMEYCELRPVFMFRK